MDAGDRLAAARERSGLSAEAIAERVGLPVALYRELESDATALCSKISLADLRAVAHVVGLTPRELLLNEAASQQPARASFAELASAVRQAVSQSQLSIEMWSEAVGWEVGPLLVNPEYVWRLSVDALKDICVGARRDWLAFLPD